VLDLYDERIEQAADALEELCWIDELCEDAKHRSDPLMLRLLIDEIRDRARDAKKALDPCGDYRDPEETA
jgi:hypothetical protein